MYYEYITFTLKECAIQYAMQFLKRVLLPSGVMLNIKKADLYGNLESELSK